MLPQNGNNLLHQIVQIAYHQGW